MTPTDTVVSDRVENPSTSEEWKTYEGELIQLKNGSGGRKLVPGARLLRIDGDTAVVQPPKHRRTEEVPLSDLKLWRKGMHNEQVRKLGYARAVGNPETGGGPRGVIVYSLSKQRYLGGYNACRGFAFGPEDASGYLSKSQASIALCAYQRGHGRVDRADIRYAIRSDAIALEAKEGREKIAKEKRDAPAKALAESILDKALKRSEPAPAVPTPPPDLAPKPEPAKAAACAACWQEYAGLVIDEAEAEALMLETRARRVVSEAKLRLDQERRRLGL